MTPPSEGLPASIDKLGGDNQTGVVGKPLRDSLLVRVTDGKDRPVQGQRVAFVFVAGGSGSLLVPDTAVTDADGRARAVWGLGSLAGQQRVEARVISTALKATFTATAQADVADTVFAVKGTGQTGVVGGLLTDSLAVLVTDRFGNPIAGQAVTWTVPAGQGSVSAANTVTGADGRAAVTRTLGPSTGAQTTTATAAGIPGSPVTFTHTATSGSAVRLVKLFGDNGIAPVGSRLTDSLVVQVQDAVGNGVPGRNVNWVITTGGGSVLPTTSVTDANGKAFTVWTLGPVAGANSVTAAAAGLPQVTFAATGTAAQPTQIAAQTPTSQAGTAGQVVTSPPSVRVADSNNNPVQGVTVTFQVTAGGGTVANATGSGASVNVATGATGIATLTNWTLGTVAGANTLTATASGAGINGNPVTFNATGNPGAATHVVYVQGPSNATAGQTISPAVTVAIQDANGNLVTTATNSVTLALGANPGGGTLGGTKTVAASGGIATFGTLTVDKAAAGYTLAASATGLTGATSGSFIVSPAAAAALAFIQQPTSAAAGGVLTPPVTVAVQDAFGNTVTSATTAVALSLTGGTGGAVLTGGGPVSAVNGVATFSGLSVNLAGTAYALQASGGGLPIATSGAFSVGSGAPTRLAFVQQPTTTAAGSAITPAVTVAIQDANGNTVTSATDSVFLAISPNATGATLGGTTRVAAVGGIATFSGVTVNKVGTGYTLVASSGSYAGATSGTFDITVGTGLKLVFGIQPSTVAAGSLITPAVVVRVEDAVGNLATTFVGSVTIALGTNPGSGSLTGTLTQPVAGGVATFNDLSVNRAAAGYTLSATSSSATSGTSASFTVTPGTAARLRIVQEPGTSTAGQAIAPSPIIQVEDALGNLVTTSTATIGAALVANPGGDVLGGTTSQNAVAGVATFPSLSLSKAAAGYTIQFSSGVLVADTTIQFTVSPTTPSVLAFLQGPPTNVVAGGTITPAVTVLVRDAFGNTVTSAVTSVGLTLTGGTGGAVLSGGSATAAVNGVVTFSGLSVNLAGTGYALQAAATGLTGATSGTFDVTAGTATKLAFQVQPAGTTAGATLATVQVVVQDAQGNAVAGSTAQVDVALTIPGGATLSGTTSVNASGGVAAFGTLSVDKTGSYTLTATSGSLTSAVSASFSITPGAASQLVFTGQPSDAVAGSAIQPPVQVTVQDALGNTVTSATTQITVAIGTNPSAGLLSGTKIVNATAGVALFSNLAIDKAGTGYTLTADGGSLPQATSAAFDIQVGSGNKLAFTVQPSNGTVGTAISPAIKVAIQDALGNTIGTATDSIRLSLFPAGGLGGTVGARAVGGVATFSNITIASAGTGYTLTAFAPVAVPALSSATSTTFDIAAAATTTTITNDTPDPTVTGQAYTVSFSVASAGGTPAGNVTVSDGTDSCMGALAGGTGSCSFTSTTAGGKSLVATYSGGTSFSGSVSSGVGHTVNKASTAIQISSDTPDPSVTGQDITVNWNSFVVAPGNGTPTGNVTVSDGTGASCVVPVGAGSCILTPATVGSKTLTATYAGDANFNGAGDTEPHGVTKASTTTTIGVVSPDPSNFGQAVTVNYSVVSTAPGTGTPTGTVAVSDGTSGCSATVAAGSCSYTPASVGTKSLTVTYAGDANYSTSSATGTTLTVNAVSTSTAITAHTPDPVTLGGAIAVTVSVTSGTGAIPAGSVVVSDDLGATCSIASLTGGGGSCNLTPTAAGARTLTAAYTPSSGNFTSSSSAGVSHTVSAASSTTTITADTPDPSVTGQSVAVSVTVTGPGGTPTGTVTVSDGSVSCPVTLASGAGSCNLTFATAGARTLTATYSGDTNFNGSSDTEAHAVSAAATTTTITGSSPTSSTVGQAYTVSFSVAVTAPGAGTPTGNVTVSDGTDQCVGTVAAGSCSLTSTTAGSKTLVATYAGDANFTGSTSAGAGHAVSTASTAVSISGSSPNPSTVGQAYTVSYSVGVIVPGAGTPTGNVTVSDGTDQCVGTAAAGSCSLTSTTAGAKSLVATYAGDANFAGSVSAGAAHTVSQASTTATITGTTPSSSTVGQAYTVNFTATSGGGIPTGNVTVSDGTDFCVGTVAAGSCSLTSTTAGIKSLVATYAGDANFTGSVSAGFGHTVNGASSVTTITGSTPSPSLVGQAYTASFTVTSAGGTPTGNVTVSDGTAQCVGTVAAGSCSLISTTAGSKTLVATYAGDANFTGSVSLGVGHTVSQAATTTAISGSSPSPSTVGQAYTVTYSVSVTAPGAGTPTGNVTVSDGTAQCVGTVAAGSCSLTSTTAGAKSLVATYAGDANFTGSVSAGAGHTVNQASTSTAVTGSTPDPSAVGQAYTVNFTVTSGGGIPTGNVTVSDGLDSCLGTVAAGSCSLTSTTAGSKSLIATYAGDANFTGSVSVGVSHTVSTSGATTTITSDTPDPSVTGQSVAVSVTVTGAGATPTGTVTISDGVVSCPVTLSSGGGSCNLTFATAGARTLTATYSGDGNYGGSGDTEPHTVNKASTTTTVGVISPSPATFGQAVTVNYSVAVTAPGAGTPTGTVTVSDGVGGCSASVAAGSCSYTPASIGTKTLSVSYAGDADFNISSTSGTTFTVNAAATTTAISAHTPDPVTLGNAIAVTVGVTTTTGAIPSGSVLVSDDLGATCSIASLTSGSGSCNLTPTAAGTRTLTAAYTPSSSNFGSSSSAGVSHTVSAAASTTAITGSSPNPSTVGQAYTVTFTVSGSSPTGNVTVSDGTDQCIGTVAAGSCSLTSTTAGAKTLVATYAGDANNTGSVSLGAGHTVSTAATTTAITSDTPDPSVVGQQITVNFTVTSAFGTPTGTVSVSDGTDGCSASVATGSCSFTPTTSGAKTLTASYPGDATHAISSGTAAHQVDPFGTANHLAFGVQPSPVTATFPITPAVTVRIEDAFGNLVASATDVVVMTLANDPNGTSVLTYTAPVSALGGIATFSDLAIDLTGNGFTLQAASGSLTSATSTAFNVQ